MSDFPVLRTKISPPYRRDEILSRERLIELFDDLLEKKLVILTAPAGYGKTSLLVDLAHRHELTYCWYSLDSLDKELGRFLTHFVAAIQLQYPQFGVQSMAALQNLIAAGDAASGERFLVTLVNELYQTIREHFTIVLDDYHNLDDNLEINNFISRFVQEVDQNCHLVILSRTLLPLPDLPLMVARSQVGGLGMQELAFRTDEIQALMLQNYQQVVPDKVADELAQRTEGWITGLLLSAQSMWQGMLDRLRVARVSGVGLYDYLVHQVLEQQSAELQDFLLKSAYLEEFNAEICADLIYNLPDAGQAASLSASPGQGDSLTWTAPSQQQIQAMQKLAQQALKNNLFVTPVGENASWLRYHPLFREFLQSCLAKKQPEAARQVLYSLVRIYGQRDEWERAYAACQQLEDPSTTAGLLEQAAHAMLTGGRISLFQRWLNALPPGMLESRPLLLGRFGLVLATQGESTRGLDYLDQALRRYQAEAPHPRGNTYTLQLAAIYVWRALVQQIRGSYTHVLDDTANALALLERDGHPRPAIRTSPEATRLRSEAYRIRGTCQRQLGKLDEAIRNYSTSLGLYQAQGNTRSVNLVLLNLGAAYLDAAEFGSALSCYKRALDYYLPQNDPFSLSSVLNDMACLYHLQGEYTQAFSTFEEALSKATTGANLRVQALVLTGMGDLHLDLQALDLALESYRQARPITEQLNDRFLMIYLDLAVAAVYRLKGDFAAARLSLNAAGQISQSGPSDNFRFLHQLESGRLALAEQDYAAAAGLLARAAAGFEAGGQRVEAGRARLLLADACFMQGDLPAAVTHLVAMFQLVDRWENQHSLVPTARQVRPLLQQVTEIVARSEAPLGDADPLLGRKVLRLLDQIDRLESNLLQLQRRLRRQTSLVEPSPPRLQIHALGKIEVLLRQSAAEKQPGKPGRKSVSAQITSADWQTQVTRDLFFLILSDERGWTKERLGELLWPGSTPAQMKLRFKNTIYRLRRALQQDAILFEGERYSFNRALDYEYDVDQFRELLEQASENISPKKKIKALQSAMQLYRGDYLPEVSGAWVLPEQERLRQAFLGGGLQLVRLYQETGQTAQMAADSCLEEAYLVAMQVQATAGNRPAVARLYERLSQSLRAELNASPSAQVESLYQSLGVG
jgi:LuxR family maltose regulon positive regulatory protein